MGQFNPHIEAFIHRVVATKLRELERTPVGVESGRRLELRLCRQDGTELSREEKMDALTSLLLDIGRRAGIEVLLDTPAVVLEQFCIMSVQNNHDTAGLLKSLRNSFMLTYLTPETSDRALAHLEGIEHLRGELKRTRGICQPPLH